MSSSENASKSVSVEIGSGILFDVSTKGRHVLICVDGETYVFPASTARQIVDALSNAAARAHEADR